jgi:hypothetical protein
MQQTALRAAADADAVSPPIEETLMAAENANSACTRLMIGRALASLLYTVRPVDPIAFASASLGFLFAVLIAGLKALSDSDRHINEPGIDQPRRNLLAGRDGRDDRTHTRPLGSEQIELLGKQRVVVLESQPDGAPELGDARKA